jgi:hypothetical protein
MRLTTLFALCCAVVISGLTMTVAVAAEAKPSFLFKTEVVPGGEQNYKMLYEIPEFTALLTGDERIKGTALSERAVSRSAGSAKYKNEPTSWGNIYRLFPTGSDDCAVTYAIGKPFDLQSASILLAVRGRGWKADSGLRETLVRFEGKEGALELATDGQGKLVVHSGDSAVIAVTPTATLDGVHTLAVNLAEGTATLHWDGTPLGSGKYAGLTGVSKVVLGQVGKGPGENKDLLQVTAYDRPLVPAQISQWHLDIGVQPPAHLTAVQCKSPVTIDGVINPEEWATAARITGLVSVGADHQYIIPGPASMAADQSVFYLTYDADNLYVAHHSPPPARIAGQTQLVVAMLKRTLGKHDEALVMDDNIKLTFMDGYPQGEEKKIYINGSDITYEFLPLAWDPKITCKSRLTDTGWWLEAAIAWKDLNVGMPEPGKTIRMNMLRGWRQEMDENHAWTFGVYDPATGERVLEREGPNPAGAMTLAGPSGVVVRLDHVGPLNQGKVDIKATLVNATDRPVTLKALLGSNSGAVRGERQEALQPNARRVINFTGTITDFVTHTVTFQVVDAESGQEYFAQGWPVRRTYEPEIYVRKYRSRDLIVCENNFEYLSEFPVKEVRAQLFITDKKTGKNVYKHAYTLPDFHVRDEVSTKDWPVGNYEIAYRFTMNDTVVGTAKTLYAHAPLPAWWNNTLGADDERAAPYPWTDMQVNGDTVDCWGRRYHFSKLLFPEQIETQGRKLLRAPMTVTAKTADGTVLSSATAQVTESTWRKQSPIRVEGVRTIGAGDVQLQNDFWAEYDGLVWNTLTIVPAGDKPVTISELTLDIPITPEFTDVMNAYDYGLTNTGAIHAYEGANAPIWLGNGIGGIQWLCETDGYFFVKDATKVVRVIPGAEGGTIRIVMIDTPTTFAKSHSIAFGFNATPTRPKLWQTGDDPLYWGMEGSVGGYWYPNGQEFLAAPDYGFKGGWRPSTWVAKGYNYTAAERDLSRYSWLTRCYITTGAVRVDNPDGQNFGDEWLASAGTRLKGVVTTTHASKSFRDYFVWRHWNAMHNEYPYQSWYYDTPNEMPSSNVYAGAGYVKPDGTRVGIAPFLGARDICKRMYNIMVRWYPFAWIGMHTSGMMNTAYVQFGTDLVDGENFNSIIGPSHPTYVGVLTPEIFRAQYMGFNITGQRSWFMGQGRMGWDEAKQMGGAANLMDHLQGLFLLHDNYPLGWIFGKNQSGILDQAGKRCWDAIDKHQLFSPFYVFVPYFEQKAVTPPHKEFYASFYVFRHDQIDNLPMKSFSIFSGMSAEQKTRYRKVVCIFYNHSDSQGEMRIKLDWKALGFDGPQGVTASNAVHSTGFRVETEKDKDGQETNTAVFYAKPDEVARVEGDEVVFPMTAWNYRMIVLEQR